MKKLLFTIVLFISCAVMAGMSDVKCPADRPLADWDGNCYSCNEDKDLYSVNAPCEEVCPNRMNLSMPLPVQDWAGCVLDTPGNRITNFANEYTASVFPAIIPLFIMAFYLLTLFIRWCYTKIRSGILTILLLGMVFACLVGMVPALIPATFILTYCYCLYCDVIDLYKTIKNFRAKEKKIRKENILKFIVLGLCGVLIVMPAVSVGVFFSAVLFNLMIPIYAISIVSKREKQRKENK